MPEEVGHFMEVGRRVSVILGLVGKSTRRLHTSIVREVHGCMVRLLQGCQV